MEDNENVEKIETNEKLQEFERYIQNKKVAILGIDVNSMPLLDYLHKHNAKVTVFDSRCMDNINTNIIDKITGYCMGMSFGENYLSRLQGFDLIFRSQSIRPDEKEIQDEVERGAILTSEAEMIIDMCPGTVIAIIDNDEKSINVDLVCKILKQENLNCFLCENDSISLFSEICKIKEADYLVIELNSYQLMDMQVKPDMAVIASVSDINPSMHQSYEEYLKCVKNIFKYQDKSNILVLNYDNENIREFEKEASSNVIFFSIKEKLDNGYIYNDNKIKYCENGIRRHILDASSLKINELSNIKNICTCIATTASLVSIDNVIKAIIDFFNIK